MINAHRGWQSTLHFSHTKRLRSQKPRMSRSDVIPPTANHVPPGPSLDKWKSETEYRHEMLKNCAISVFEVNYETMLRFSVTVVVFHGQYRVGEIKMEAVDVKVVTSEQRHLRAEISLLSISLSWDSQRTRNSGSSGETYIPKQSVLFQFSRKQVDVQWQITVGMLKACCLWFYFVKIRFHLLCACDCSGLMKVWTWRYTTLLRTE